MDQYYNHLVELLVNNIGISRQELYIKSGMSSKRDFISEINQLKACYRITSKCDRHLYSPRVLFIVECDINAKRVTKEISINYLPTDILKNTLGYVSQGVEPEDCLEYELEITGYEIKEEHKPFFEAHNKINFNFRNYKYFLWVKYV